MKKILIATILFAVLTVAVMPNVTGYVAESVINQLAARINASHRDFGEINVLDYQRGYRTSKSSFNWAPGGRYKDVVEQAMEFNCEGTHGVVSYSYQCKLANLQPYNDFVERKLGGQDPLTMGGEVSLFGTVTQRIEIDAFELQAAAGDALRVLPGRITLVTDGAFSAFELDGKFAGLDAKGPRGWFLINDISIDGNFSFNQHNLVIGNFSLLLESAKLASIEDGEISFKDLTMNSQFVEQGSNLSIGYQLGVADFARGQKQSESMDLRNMAVDFQMDGIDMAKMAIINEKLQALAEQADSASNAYFLTILPDLEDLLKPGLALNSKLSADYLSDPVTAEIGLTLLGNLSFADYLLLRVNPSGVFAKIEARLNAQVPQSLLENHPQAKSAILASPWYTKSGRNYASSFQMSGGKFSLNGAQISADELLKLISRPKRNKH